LLLSKQIALLKENTSTLLITVFFYQIIGHGGKLKPGDSLPKPYITIPPSMVRTCTWPHRAKEFSKKTSKFKEPRKQNMHTNCNQTYPVM